VHGETQQKLDVIANDILMHCLGSRPTIACVASEENEEPTILKRGVDGGKYCVVFDPLDGSSNLDVCVSVGTVFSILRNDPNVPVQQILFDPSDTTDNTIFVGNDLGVYQTTDMGKTWHRYGVGFPMVRVVEMRIAKNSGLLRVGTYGRGLWEI